MSDDGTFTLSNVRVFDGTGLTEPRDVHVENGLIEARGSGGRVIDGSGAALLPGLIDAHVHFDSVDNLGEFVRWGVTTALDMGSRPKEFVDSLRGRRGLTDVRSSGSPASGHGSLQTTKNGFDESTALAGPDEAARFVADRVAEGSDYVKIIIENPSDPVALSTATVEAIVRASHDAGFVTIAHAASTGAYQTGIDAGVDFLTHSPLDTDLAPEQIEAIVARGIRVIPTLSMMSGIADRVGMPTAGGGPGYRHAVAAVRALHAAGVSIVAGTDANNARFVPFNPVQGESLHGELEKLVDAGLTPVEALRSATSVVAELFGLDDRGAVEPGRRADLVLVDGDPTADITATRALRGVWVRGVRA